MANHITRLILDNSAFDPELGKSIKLVNMMYANIDALCKGMVGLDGPQRQMIANLGKLQYNAESASVMVGKLDKMFQDLKQTYSGMDIHTKMSAWGKSTSSMMLEFSRQIKAIQAQIAAIPDVTTKKVYIQPVTSVSGGESSTASAAASAASAGDALSSIGGKKGAFSAILGGNLAARAVMDAVRLLKNTIMDAVQANMEFEYSNATLAAVLGKTKEEIHDLTAQAQKLGATSLYSAKEITELQVVLARLGFNKEEIEDSTDAIAKLALATGVDLEKAANLTGSTLRAFGYDTKEAGRVASVLGVSTTKSALDMQKLATAMSYASSVSRQAGFEIEEVVAMLGKLVDNGMQATTAGVNIRNIMLDLSNKSSKLSKAIKQVTGKDQIRGLDEFTDALQKMREQGINLDDVANVVQKRVTPGFLNLVANTEGITKLRDELKGCTGELDVMADKMENTLSGATKKLKNSWNALMLEFANNNGGLTRAITLIDKLVDSMAKFRRMKFGGQGLVDYYDRVLDEGTKEGTRKNVEKLSDEQKKSMAVTVQADNANRIAERDKLMEYYAQYSNMYNDFNDALAPFRFEKKKAIEEFVKQFEQEFPQYTGKMGEELAKIIADKSYQIKSNEYLLSLLDPEAVKSNSTVSADISGNTGLNIKEIIKNSNKSVDDALANYAIAIREAEIEYNAGAITKKQYDQKVLSAMETVYKAYGNAAATLADTSLKKSLNQELEQERKAIEEQFNAKKITEAEYNNQLQKLNSEYGALNAILSSSKYKDAFANWASNISKQAEIVAQDDLNDKVAKAKETYYKAIDRAILQYDNDAITELEYNKKMLSATTTLTAFYETLASEDPEKWCDAYEKMLAEMRKWTENVNRLEEVEDKKKTNTRIRRGLESYAKQTGNGSDYYGLNGELQKRINNGEDIDWTPFENAINNDLGKKHFQIKVDVDTGSIDKIKDKIRDELSNFQTGVSAFSNIVNGFDNIKNSIDSWIETMGKGESAWDMMMSTINVGISTLQTTASIIDSILTLTELSEMASDAMTASTMRQATASGVNTIAKAAETQATKEDAKANIVDASAKAMNAHAWIPWVGVAIGVAAVATLIASLASAKNAGNFAEGGIVPGNSPTGDKLIAHVNSGEGILTAQGVRNLGSLYAGQGYRSGSIEVYGRVSGKDILLASNNYNRARGGSRGAYTQIK